MWTIILFAACSDPEPQVTAALPAPDPAAVTTEETPSDVESDTEAEELGFESRLAAFELDEWEDGLLADIVEATREGVQLYGEQGFGGIGRYNGFTDVAVHQGKLYILDNAGAEVEVYTIVHPGAADQASTD